MKRYHICHAGSAFDLVCQVVSDEPVVAMEDDLAIGPLDDVDDEAPVKREAFWRALFSVQPVMPDFSRALQEGRRRLATLGQDVEEVVIWRGTRSGEWLMGCRVHWWLRDAAAVRVKEIRVAKQEGEFPGIVVPMLTLEELRARASESVLVSAQERATFAQIWETWRASGAGIREWRDGQLRGCAIDGNDAYLLSLAGDGPHRLAHLIGQLMAGTARSDTFCLWRVATLVQTGKLRVVQGSLDDWRHAYVGAV